MPIIDIKNELSNLGFSVYTEVQLKDFPTKLPIPIFLDNLFANEHFPQIFSTDEILGFVVKIETYSKLKLHKIMLSISSLI